MAGETSGKVIADNKITLLGHQNYKYTKQMNVLIILIKRFKTNQQRGSKGTCINLFSSNHIFGETSQFIHPLCKRQ